MTTPDPSPVRQPWWRRWVWPTATLVALLVGIGIGAAGSSNSETSNASAPAPSPAATVTVTAQPSPAPTVTVTATATVTAKPAPPPGPQTTGLAAGTYVVGSDIAPGTYKTEGPDGSNLVGCYWARLSALTGDAIIANNISKGADVVQILPGDKGFETSGCKPWSKVG